MKELFIKLKNQPLSIKLPLILTLLLVSYMFVSFGISAYNEKKINDEFSKLKFKVSKVYFETRFVLRSYMDKYMILELSSPITQDQFNQMTFSIPGEDLSPELIADNKIKINFNSPFRKTLSLRLTVSFYNRNIYSYDFKNSNFDAEDAKNNPIDEIDKY